MSRVLAISVGVGITLALSGCGGQSCFDVVKGLNNACAAVPVAEPPGPPSPCQDKKKFCDKCFGSDADKMKKIGDDLDKAKANATTVKCWHDQQASCSCATKLSSVALPADEHTNTFSTV